MRQRNPAARAVRSPKFRPRRVKALKGKGSYVRRPKHRGGGFSFRPAVSRGVKAGTNATRRRYR